MVPKPKVGYIIISLAGMHCYRLMMMLLLDIGRI